MAVEAEAGCFTALIRSIFTHAVFALCHLTSQTQGWKERRLLPRVGQKKDDAHKAASQGGAEAYSVLYENRAE